MINDSLGHAAGDQLLVEVALRLRDCCRRKDTASRLGGDEFAILLENIDHVDEAVRAADRIATALREPFIVAGKEAFVAASTGIAVKDDATCADEIIRNADIAMYLANLTVGDASPCSSPGWTPTCSRRSSSSPICDGQSNASSSSSSINQSSS